MGRSYTYNTDHLISLCCLVDRLCYPHEPHVKLASTLQGATSADPYDKQHIDWLVELPPSWSVSSCRWCCQLFGPVQYAASAALCRSTGPYCRCEINYLKANMQANITKRFTLCSTAVVPGLFVIRRFRSLDTYSRLLTPITCYKLQAGSACGEPSALLWTGSRWVGQPAAACCHVSSTAVLQLYAASSKCPQRYCSSKVQNVSLSGSAPQQQHHLQGMHSRCHSCAVPQATLRVLLCRLCVCRPMCQLVLSHSRSLQHQT